MYVWLEWTSNMCDINNEQIVGFVIQHHYCVRFHFAARVRWRAIVCIKYGYVAARLHDERKTNGVYLEPNLSEL